MAVENRLHWTDVDWAQHLGCPEKMVGKIRHTINTKYSANIAQDPKTNWYRVTVKYLDKGRTITVAVSGNSFESWDSCWNYAYHDFIPSLELNRAKAKLFAVPRRAIQMLQLGNVREG